MCICAFVHLHLCTCASINLHFGSSLLTQFCGVQLKPHDGGYYRHPHQVAFQQTHNYNTTQAKTKTQLQMQTVWWGILSPVSSDGISAQQCTVTQWGGGGYERSDGFPARGRRLSFWQRTDLWIHNAYVNPQMVPLDTQYKVPLTNTEVLWRMRECMKQSRIQHLNSFQALKNVLGASMQMKVNNKKYYFSPLTINNLWQCSMPSLGSPHCPIFTWDS